MAEPMKVLDMGALLNGLAGDALKSGLTTVYDSPHSLMSLLRIQAGEHWESDTADTEERCIIVLEGWATFSVDNTRRSLGSGHIAHVEPGAVISAKNESDQELLALLIISPPPSVRLLD